MTDLEKMQPGKKSVHLEEPDSGKMLNAAAGKTSSAGRGRRLTEDYDDGFISRQIAETLGTGHRSGGSSGNVASSSCSSQHGGGGVRVDMKPKLKGGRGRGRKSLVQS